MNRKSTLFIAILMSSMSGMAATSSVLGSSQPPTLLPGASIQVNKIPAKIQKDTPDGEVSNYIRSSDSYWSLFGNIMATFDRGSIAKFAVDGDRVFYYNPFGMQAVDSWIEGSLSEDGKMTFHFPQEVMTLGSTTYFASVVSVSADGFGFTEDQTYVLIHDGEKIVAEDPQLLLAMTSWTDSSQTALGWTGYGDKNPVCLPFSETNEAPEDNIAIQDWMLINGGKTRTVSVGHSDSEFWVKGLVSNIPDAWAKGSVKNGKIVFQSGQYMGEDIAGGHYNFLHGCSVDSVYNKDYEWWEEKYPLKESMSMDYDAEFGLAKALPMNNFIFTTTKEDYGVDGNLFLTFIREPILKLQNRKADTPPATPVLDDYSPYDNDFYYGYFTISIPPYDIDYNILDTDNLFYQIYVNDKPFTFYPDEYDDLEEEMSIVPYNYTDYYWISVNGQKHTIYFFFEGAKSISARSMYKENDQEIWSDYVTILGNSSTVALNKDFDCLKSEEIFDIAGRRLQSIEKGINIIRRTFENGTVETHKIMVK